MDPRRTRANSIYFAIIALAVSSTWSVVSIWGTRPAEELESGGRGPASVQSAAPATVEMDVLRLGCWDHPTTKLDSPRAHWVRLLGEGCGQTNPVEVTNRTNGFNATVFNLNAQDRTTDFIPLEHGANDVQIVVGEGSNRRTFALTLSH